MKKLFMISGVLTLAFGFLFIFGILDFNHTVGYVLAAGNRLYTEEDYNEALEAYGPGLQKEPENPMLNYNAAQASYQVKAYDKAAEFYGKASASVDLYLNWGNSFFRLGDGTEDANQKLQHFANALDTYKQGILAFPQSVELKYNYEYVLEKLKELQKNMENQPQNNQDNQEDQDQNQQQGGGQQNQNDSPQGQQNDQQGNQQNEGSPQDDQQGEVENNPAEEQQNDQQTEGQDDQQNPQDQQAGDQDDQQNSEDQQSGASSQDEQQSDPSAAAGDEESNGQTTSSAEEAAQNSSEIEQILQMLEKQEEQALKNNQRVRNSSKEDEHDW